MKEMTKILKILIIKKYQKKKNKWSHYERKKPAIGALLDEEVKKVEHPPKAVIFVQCTENSELASEMRKIINYLKPWTAIGLKVVECAGEQLQEILCKSNPWENESCERDCCFTCESSIGSDDTRIKSCRQRSVVYQTWCNTCYKGTTEKADNLENERVSQNNGKRERTKEKQKGPLFQYIGKSSRSTFERGLEHLKDLEYRRVKSHLLRHCIEIHPEVEPEQVEFKMKQISSHKSAFERQLKEAVLIEINAGPLLMNSKIEYSRCMIPKIKLKLGNNEEEEDPLKTKEKEIREKIQLKYKSENKRQRNENNEAKKRRKVEKIEIGVNVDENVGESWTENGVDEDTGANVPGGKRGDPCQTEKLDENVHFLKSDQTVKTLTSPPLKMVLVITMKLPL